MPSACADHWRQRHSPLGAVPLARLYAGPEHPGSRLDKSNKKGRGEFAPTSCRLSSAASTSVVNVQAVAPPRHSVKKMRDGAFGSKF